MSDTAHLEELITCLTVSVTDIQSNIVSMKADITEMKADITEIKSDVSELKSDVSELKSDVSELKSEMVQVKNRLGSLEDTVYDFREEFRSESTATRSLLNQAFEHISDQIAEPDHKPIPSLVFRARPRATTPV